MGIKDKELEHNLHNLIDRLERLNDSVGPTNLRHHISEVVVNLRNDMVKYDQDDDDEQNFDYFHPEKEVSRRYITLLTKKGFIPIQDANGTTDPDHLLWMLYEIINNESMSATKKNRWLGFIQGCMVKDGYINVEQERHDTRSIFHGK